MAIRIKIFNENLARRCRFRGNLFLSGNDKIPACAGMTCEFDSAINSLLFCKHT